MLTNLIFERLFTGNQELFPKFSIYRLMMTTFYKLVMNPLMTNTKSYRSPINLYSNMYSSSVLKELEENLEMPPICNECSLYETSGGKGMAGNSNDPSNGLNRINSLLQNDGRTTISSTNSDFTPPITVNISKSKISKSFS
mgnify:CR=1 FL=1